MKANGLAGHKNTGEREKDDFYPTPPTATQALLDQEGFSGTVWEPACGDGAISEVLISNGFRTFSSDLFDRGYGKSEIDFLKFEPKQKVGNIITNPPFKLAHEFVEKSLDCVDGKVAMLLKLNFLESARRYELFKNTPLKTVHVFSKRVNFYEATLKDEKKRSGVLAYAWYVWDKEYDGKPQLEWIL